MQPMNHRINVIITDLTVRNTINLDKTLRLSGFNDINETCQLYTIWTVWICLAKQNSI